MAELEEAIKASTDRHMTRRLDTMRILLQGKPFADAVDFSMKNERTVRRWVTQWNTSGIDGLATRPGRGRKRKITPEQGQVIGAVLQHPQAFDKTHWTLLKLQGTIKQAFAIEFGYSTFARWVHDLGFRQLVPRPEAPDRDPEARAAFAAELQQILGQNPDAIWFMDEAGFLADPRPKRLFARKGTKPVCPMTGLHIRLSVIGGVQPTTGRLHTLIFDRVDRHVFQYFLDDLDRVTEGQEITLVMDNASWHKVKELNWHQITPLYLPTYSPDLNPIERIWKYLKEHKFANWWTRSREQLMDRLAESLVEIMNDTDRVKSVSAFSGH